VARPLGYLLRLAEDGTDLQIFTGLLAETRHITDPAGRVTRLRAALDLWRGPPLADLSGLTWLDGQAERLAALRLDTLDALVDARLQLGQHADLVAELSDLTGRHPYREPLHAQLMLALYRSGAAAYAPPSEAEAPADLLAAIAAVPPAQAMFDVLTKTNRFALIYRLNAVKRAETRERKIGEFVAMLARHETIHPQKAKPPAAS
jgi:hypothetical protein